LYDAIVTAYAMLMPLMLLTSCASYAAATALMPLLRRDVADYRHARLMPLR